MFITTKSEFKALCPVRKQPKYRMSDFYANCRKKTQILMENDKPIGGKWSFDKENRRKIPANIEVPTYIQHEQTNYYERY